jgi:hypothetical protein
MAFQNIEKQNAYLAMYNNQAYIILVGGRKKRRRWKISEYIYIKFE